MTQQVPASMTVEGLTSAAITASLSTKANDSAVVHNTGNETIAGVKTFSSQPVMPTQSMIRLNTANGYGSTNTAIRRFTNTVVSQGTDITYADSAANGASFTINVAGVYAITYADCFTAVSSYHGLSLNSSQLTTSIASITAADRLTIFGDASGNYGGPATWVGYLAAGAVIRPHAVAGVSTGTMPQDFTICRVS